MVEIGSCSHFHGDGRVLSERGAVVTEAATVEAALAAIARRPPDILVSDIGMPGKDGYDLIRAVRAQGLDLPAIALTAFARLEDRRQALAAGFHTHLGKPVDPADLVATVATLAGRARQR